MRRTRLGRLYLLSVCLVGVVALLPAQAAENYLMVTMPSAESAQTKNISAKVSIDAPPSYVWQIITDYERLDDILPGYEKSELVSGGGTVKTLALGMKVNPFLPRYNYQVRVSENPSTQQIRLQRVSGDFKSLNAVYKLIPQNGGKQTMLVYDLAVDPGARIPGAGAILKASTEKTLKALQAHIEQSHRKSVIGQR